MGGGGMSAAVDVNRQAYANSIAMQQNRPSVRLVLGWVGARAVALAELIAVVVAVSPVQGMA